MPQRKERAQLTMIVSAIVVVIGLVVAFNTIGMIKVDGNEAVVRQNWKTGVLRAVDDAGNIRGSDVYRDGTHFYVGWFWDLYRYNIGLQKLTMDSSTDNPDAEYPSLVLAVGEEGGQKVQISGSIVYMIGHSAQIDTTGYVEEIVSPAMLDAEGNVTAEAVVRKIPQVITTPEYRPDLLVALHNSGNGKDYESVILKRVWQEVVTSIATERDALTLYSGEGFEKFRLDVDAALKAHPVLNRRGIFIESTIMYPVRLDPAYEAEIAAKKLAEQTKLKEKELALAADERAKKVTSEKQAEVNAMSQEAEALKQAQMKKAEADAYQKKAAAEAERYRQEQEAVGILALKVAEAEGQKALTDALYGGQAGQRRFQVESATAWGNATKGVLDGVQVIPNNALVQLLQDPTNGSVRVNMDAPRSE